MVQLWRGDEAGVLGKAPNQHRTLGGQRGQTRRVKTRVAPDEHAAGRASRSLRPDQLQALLLGN
eukprot:scaffold3218_cov99-Isochrysis_galbana.AAC.9